MWRPSDTFQNPSGTQSTQKLRASDTEVTLICWPSFPPSFKVVLLGDGCGAPNKTDDFLEKF